MGALDVAVRFGLYLDLSVAFGVPFFALYAFYTRGALPLRFLLAVAGVAGLGFSALGLVATAASMAGEPLNAVDAASLTAILTGMALGKAWIVRVVGLAVVVVAAMMIRSRPVAALSGASLGGAMALGSLAWGGHGAMDEGAVGWFHLGADIAHLLAAGLWVGALLCLLLLVAGSRDAGRAQHLRATHRALDNFSVVGSWTVAVIVATGLVNGWLLVGPANLWKVPGSLYGQLLLAKLALFGAMLCLAAANRYRLTPALEARIGAGDHAGAVTALRISLALESASAALILALVAWLGTLEPVVSAG